MIETSITPIKVQLPPALPLTKDQVGEIKNLLLSKLEKAQEELDFIESCYMNNRNNGTDDTSPTFKGVENGSEDASRADNEALAKRKRKYIGDLKSAILNTKYKSFGICRITGKPIGYERMILVPHATLSVEGKLIEDERKNRN